MQKQEASILSAELSGFQSMVESLTSEEITPLLSEIHALVENTARLHQGKINRYTGDTFLAIFQFNKTNKNALDSAIELKDQLISFISERKPDLLFNMKIGIASGGIITADVGDDQKQQTLMGEAVNNATRISQFAGEGQILADDKTMEGLADDYEFQKLEPIPLKGGTETLAVFELLCRKRKKLDLKVSGERKIASEMVGRSREMEQLESLFNQLVAGKGSVVNIVGKAGIGKSRLMAEMKVQPIIENVVLLEGRALSTGKNLSFHPIIHLIKSWAGISEDDPPAVSAEKLQKGIQQIAPEQSDDIYAFLATMMGLPLTGKYSERIKDIEGEALEKLILKNLRDLIINATKDKPRIYLIEDMHWSDNSSITFFESLFKLSQKYPVMFINVLRPGYKETGDYMLKYLVDELPDDHFTVHVSPLENTDSGLLIGNLLHNIKLPANINEMIITKSEGNPFFIEEIIRSFLDDGIIEINDKDFRITEKIQNVNIPETINDVILSRVDKLDEKTKELLNTASVIGRNFYYKVLEEAADTIGELDERLEYLKDVQLIGESKKKDEIEYLFKHALAQQATYESIVLNSKKELHLKIARSIEKVFSENLNEYYGTLAYHYEKAEDQKKTEEYLIKAGDQASESAATSAAINFYQNVLKIYLQQPNEKTTNIKLRDIYYKLGFAYQTRGLTNKTIEIVDNALKLYGYKVPKGKVPLMTMFIFNLIYFVTAVYNEKYFFKKFPTVETNSILYLSYYRGEALAMRNPKRFFLEQFYFGRLLAHTDLSKSPIACGLFIGFSVVFFWTGISLKIGGRILRIAEKYINRDYIYSYLKYRYMKKMHEYHSGIIRQDDDEESIVQTAFDKGASWEAITYLLYSGFPLVEAGDRERCNSIAKGLLKVNNHFENNHARVQYYRYISFVFVKFREFDGSFAVLREGTELTEKSEYEALISVVFSNLASLYSLKGEMYEAREALNEVEKNIQKIKASMPFYSAYLMGKVRYEFAMLQHESKPGKANPKVLNGAMKELIKTAKKFRGVLPESLLLKAQFCNYLGKNRKAIKTLSKALELAQKNGAKVDLSRIYFELGKFLSDPKVKYNELNGHPASYYLDKAKAMFEEMDLQWDWVEYRKFQSS